MRVLKHKESRKGSEECLCTEWGVLGIVVLGIEGMIKIFLKHNMVDETGVGGLLPREFVKTLASVHPSKPRPQSRNSHGQLTFKADDRRGKYLHRMNEVFKFIAPQAGFMHARC